MLSALLTTIQGQLGSKRFWLASVFPLLLFVLAGGWILYRQCPAFKSWLAAFAGLKEQAILYSALTAIVLAAAYIFSAMNSTLLEWLEGRKGIARLWLLRPWLYWHQQRTLQHLQERYDTAARSEIEVGENLKSWIKQIMDARVAGTQTTNCDPQWRKSKEGKIVKKILRKAAFGYSIHSAELSTAVAAMKKLLASNYTPAGPNPSTALDTKASMQLRDAYLAFKNAIFYAHDNNAFDRTTLYNKRQFGFPGSFEGYDPSDPEPRVQNVLAITRMGNIGQTMRSYAITRYNLDLDIFWSRLQNSIQTNATTYFGVLQDVKLQVDFLVSLAWLSAIFSLVLTPWMWFRGAALEFAVAGSAGFLSLGLYSLACASYQVFADVMRGAVDLFRFKLLDDLHLGLPGGQEEEQFLWERLGNITGFARKEIIRYKHPAGK
jgi:hypothetical protein